ncbi:hypothetical protein [Pseudomonas sp. NA-150]
MITLDLNVNDAEALLGIVGCSSQNPAVDERIIDWKTRWRRSQMP